ncbi:MAG: hypothetical protein ACF8R7_02355 [Phycisphaerales bacterium JB039]
MHGLTKALVLLAALASIFLAALTMAFQVNAQTLRSELISERARADTTQTTAAASAAEHQVAEQRWGQTYQRLQSDITSLKTDATTLKSEAERLRGEKLAAEQEAEQAKNRIGQISGTVQTQAELIDRYEQEVTRLRQSELAWKQNEIALADRIADLESQLEVLNQANRALQEQIHQLQNPTEGTPQPTQVVIPTVGRVVSIEQDRATGATLARIDLGTNDGIFEDQTIFVTRGRDTFVGHLKIIRTDLQWSVGQFDDLGTGGKIRQNDIVLTSFRR